MELKCTSSTMHIIDLLFYKRSALCVAVPIHSPLNIAKAAFPLGMQKAKCIGNFLMVPAYCFIHIHITIYLFTLFR